jgi:hypothetical protein
MYFVHICKFGLNFPFYKNWISFKWLFKDQNIIASGFTFKACQLIKIKGLVHHILDEIY